MESIRGVPSGGKSAERRGSAGSIRRGMNYYSSSSLIISTSFRRCYSLEVLATRGALGASMTSTSMVESMKSWCPVGSREYRKEVSINLSGCCSNQSKTT